LQKGQAVHAGHADIGHDDVDGRCLEALEGQDRIFVELHLEIMAGQDPADLFERDGFILHNGDGQGLG
jgi:hypothetical protein